MLTAVGWFSLNSILKTYCLYFDVCLRFVVVVVVALATCDSNGFSISNIANMSRVK